MTVSAYSTTASSNTAINGININTGMPPSNVDNALRQYGKDIQELLRIRSLVIQKTS